MRLLRISFDRFQGSVLGPLLHFLYTNDVGTLLAHRGLVHRLFADDVQAYIHTCQKDTVAGVSQMCLTIDVFSSCVAANRFLQFIYSESRKSLVQLCSIRISIGLVNTI